MQLPQDAARIWTDPAQRQRIVAMHGQEMPLTQMCEELGLGDVLDLDDLRGTLENLSADEVKAIRDAFLAEASAATESGANFPVDCRVDDPSAGVRIVSQGAQRGAVGPIVRIEPA
jgi:hypothetical protein